MFTFISELLTNRKMQLLLAPVHVIYYLTRLTWPLSPEYVYAKCIIAVVNWVEISEQRIGITIIFRSLLIRVSSVDFVPKGITLLYHRVVT